MPRVNIAEDQYRSIDQGSLGECVCAVIICYGNLNNQYSYLSYILSFSVLVTINYDFQPFHDSTKEMICVVCTLPYEESDSLFSVYQLSLRL